MVASFQEELDSEDEAVSPTQPTAAMVALTASRDLDLSSEDDLEPEPLSNPVIIKDEDIDSDVDPAPVKTKASLSSMDVKKLKSSAKRTSLSSDSSPSNQSSGIKVAMTTSDLVGSDSDDEDVRPVVTVMQEEEISGDEVDNQPVDSGLATDTTQVVEIYHHGHFSPI